MSYRLVEKQVICSGKKVGSRSITWRTATTRTGEPAGRCAFTRGRWWCCRSCRTGG